MATNRFTDIEIKNIGTKPLRETLGRGNGSILFKKRKFNIEAYYVYSYNKTEPLIKLGNYKHASLPGMSAKEIRDKAKKHSELREEHPDLKGYLEYIEQQKIIEEKIHSSTGNFKEMLDIYTQSLSNKRTKDNVRNLFNHDVFGPFPELSSRKPADVGETEIMLILKKVFDRGVTTNGNRLRSYLSAAYNHAIKTTNDPLKQDKIFDVQRNPVFNIPKQAQFERIQERSLSTEEVNHFLTHIDQTVNVSNIVASTIKFLFYIGGQRPLQVLREEWSSYDYRKNTLLITDTKGRTGKREYLTPLTKKALTLLNELSTHDMHFPFTSTGKVPIRVETLLTAINKYCKQYEVEKFTLRDIRRTVKNLMIDAGVNRETRNLIQNHGLTGIDYKHYDKSDHLPEKIAGMVKYDRHLDLILKEKKDNVIQLITA